MLNYNDYVYFYYYLEDLFIQNETHRCSECGTNMVLVCENKEKYGRNGFNEKWVCPKCG